MSAPVIESGGGTTVNRKWVLEVNTGSVGTPQWDALEFMSNFAPNADDATWNDSTTFGDGGFKSQAKTAAAWSANATVQRKTLSSDPTSYGPVQEFLRSKAVGKFGAANQVQVRFYEYDTNDPDGTASPRVEAYMGFAGVQWAEQGGADSDNSTVQITLNSQSKLNAISHPYPAVAVPDIDSVTPSSLAVAGGDLVSIEGRHFTGTTGVTFAGTAATKFTVEDDGLLVVIAPAHTAGSGAVVVTNATGASTDGPNVTYA